MKGILFFSVALIAVSVVCPMGASTQAEGREGSDPIIEQVLRSNPKQLQPKKIKTRGNPKAARWEEVDRALAAFASSIDAKQLIGRLRDFHKEKAVSKGEDTLSSEVENSLSTYSIRFKDIFVLDDAVLFPLTNSVLNYVPDASLMDIQVYNKKGKVLGRFSGKYTYERSGGLTGRQGYRLVFFQYVDETGKNQTTGSDLLLDSYCARWGEIKDRPGFDLAILLRDVHP